MSYIKRFLAVVLILAISLGLVVAGNAASSLVDPGYDPETKTYTKTEDGSKVVYKVGEDQSTVLTVEQLPENPSTKSVTLDGGKDAEGEKKPVTKVGDGKSGVFDSKKGRKIKEVIVKSTEKVIFSKEAFKGSKVAHVKVKAPKVAFKKDAFKGTKQKIVVIYLYGVKKASDVSVTKGSFNGLSSKSRIVCYKKYMSSNEFTKLVKKLRKAGFKGKIIRR